MSTSNDRPVGRSFFPLAAREAREIDQSLNAAQPRFAKGAFSAEELNRFVLIGSSDSPLVNRIWRGLEGNPNLTAALYALPGRDIGPQPRNLWSNPLQPDAVGHWLGDLFWADSVVYDEQDLQYRIRVEGWVISVGAHPEHPRVLDLRIFPEDGQALVQEDLNHVVFRVTESAISPSMADEVRIWAGEQAIRLIRREPTQDQDSWMVASGWTVMGGWMIHEDRVRFGPGFNRVKQFIDRSSHWLVRPDEIEVQDRSTARDRRAGTVRLFVQDPNHPSAPDHNLSLHFRNDGSLVAKANPLLAEALSFALDPFHGIKADYRDLFTALTIQTFRPVPSANSERPWNQELSEARHYRLNQGRWEKAAAGSASGSRHSRPVRGGPLSPGIRRFK